MHFARGRRHMGTSFRDEILCFSRLPQDVLPSMEIGSRVGRTQTTVMRICDRWMQESMTDGRGRSHPPQCTTSHEVRQIVRMTVTDHSVTSRTISHHIESITHHSMSERTIRRRLKQSGLSARRPLLGLPLMQNHRRFRRQWCDERRMWVAEWNEIVFTDESRIPRWPDSSLGTPWREDAEQLRYAPPHCSCTGELLGKIKGKIVFQWVSSYCGLWGNERADFLLKKGTGILQNFRRDLTLHSAKLEIKRIFRESFRLKASSVARDKPWSTLCKKSHGIPSSPRAAAVAKFRLLTGHDCLCAHLFRFNLVTSPICVLCDTGQDMTAAHLDDCSALNDLNCIVKRYWRARCLMT
ncbi:transposable element Tcb1 transposase [Trichonephila clavipes]|nr:transposable element Tcb1 transposase [Trichonephila clavipes]